MGKLYFYLDDKLYHATPIIGGDYTTTLISPDEAKNIEDEFNNYAYAHGQKGLDKIVKPYIDPVDIAASAGAAAGIAAIKQGGNIAGRVAAGLVAGAKDVPLTTGLEIVKKEIEKR